MTQAFNTNLQAMSLLAVLIGGFLVYNTTVTFPCCSSARVLPWGACWG
ncbi:MAG: hypothetical protein R3E95_18855 [Thiolinea sp.]